MSNILDKNIEIYKIKCSLNDKMYIGQTSIGIEQRLMTHKINSKLDKTRYSHLENAIRKYGEDTFTTELLEICNINNWADREKYWISYFNTFLGEGYNMTNGGEGTIGKVSAIIRSTGEHITLSSVEYNANKDKYKSHNEGKQLVINTVTGIKSLATKKQMKNDINLKSLNKDYIVVFDTLSKSFKSVLVSEKLDTQLPGGNARLFKIFDNNNNLMYKEYGQIRQFLKSHKLPKYLENCNKESPLKYKEDKWIQSRIKNNGNIKYVGWYAEIIKITKENYETI